MTLKKDDAQIYTLDLTLGGFRSIDFKIPNSKVSKTKSKSPGSSWHLINAEITDDDSSK